jgi:hypothetical protein
MMFEHIWFKKHIHYNACIKTQQLKIGISYFVAYKLNCGKQKNKK